MASLGFALLVFWSPLIITLIVMLILLAVDDRNYPRHFDAKHIRYYTTTQDVRTQVEVKTVITEKGKEPMRVIKMTDIGLTKEIPQSMYDEYIGEGNNAMTCACSQLTMYVATARGKNIFDTCKAYTVTRYILPWETDKNAFNAIEAHAFYDALCKGKKDFTFDSLPFRFDLHNRSSESLSEQQVQTYASYY